MELPALFFYPFAGLAIAFSIFVVASRKPMTSAFSLLMVIFCFAGIYALLGAHLIAALQLLIYAGAVMVLFVFVILLLNDTRRSGTAWQGSLWVKIAVILVSLLTLGAFVRVFRHGASGVPGLTPGLFSSARIDASGGNTRVLAELLFSEYILPFELTAVLLLSAIVGSISLAKRNKRKRHER